MKRVLITGANSYIGTSFEKYVSENQVDFEIETLDLLNPSWEEFDFSRFDCIFHVAAIVHRNESKVDPNLYYSINRDLPIKLAILAKNAGVKQFVFLSTMSVYGKDEIIITTDTEENPETYYGKSKLEAERALSQLESANFKLTILRPPMVYGPHATGNYSRLAKLSMLTPVFPNIANERSMIFIGNLSAFVYNVINSEIAGVFFPQNSEYVATSSLVKNIREVHGKSTYLTALFNPIIKLLNNQSQISKLFGNLVYSKSMSICEFEYNIVDFKESIELSEKR